MAKTRFIYTTDDKIISGATKLRPKQIPNPPSPVARFSDEENITKVLHLEDHGLVFAIVKNGELSIENGPAVRPIYVLYVYDPSSGNKILTPRTEAFSFFPVGNGWSRLSEVDSQAIEGSAVKVLSIHKLSKPKGPEELNVYAEQLFVLASINNETVLLVLNVTTDIIQMQLGYSQNLANPEEFYTYLDESQAAYYGQPNSMFVSSACSDRNFGSGPWRPMDELPQAGRTYTTRNVPGIRVNNDLQAFSSFWNNNFLITENQYSYLKELEFQPDFTDRIVEEKFTEVSFVDVYCFYEVFKTIEADCSFGYLGANQCRVNCCTPSRRVFDYWDASRRYRGILIGSKLDITVPTNLKYSTITTSMVKLDNFPASTITGRDSLIKKIICFDDYRRVYAICSQVTEPNNSLYRIR